MTELELLIRLLGIVSVVLSLAILFLFIKVYRLQRSVILFGLPLGFFFLAVSYFLLAVHLIYTSSVITDFSSILMWLRVVSQTIGFTLIAVSYFLSGKSKGTTTRSSFFTICLWSMVGVISIMRVMTTHCQGRD